MSTTYSPLYPAGSFTYTIAPEGVASSTSFTSGAQSDEVVNVSNVDADVVVTGKWTTHASSAVTANTSAQAIAVAPLSDDLTTGQVWPDQITASASASRSITSASILSTLGALVGLCNIGDTTANRVYPSRPFSIVQAFGLLFLPTRHALYVTQNSGQSSHSTGSNHAWWGLRQRWQGV